MRRDDRWVHGRVRRRAMAAAVLAMALGCGGDDGPPAPYQPPARGAPGCELSADCPAGTYCDLGECYQECHTELSCSATADECTERGRCQFGGGGDTDPPPSTENDAEILAPVATEIQIGESDATAMLELTAQPSDVSVRYRIEPRVPWLTVAQPRGSFEGALFATLDVDRTGLEPGAHDGVIVVHTSAGNVTVPVRLTHGLSAMYRGTMTYTKPRALGGVPIGIEIYEGAGGIVAMRIDRNLSPLFAAGSDVDTMDGRLSAEGVLTGEFLQRFEDGDLEPEQFWDRPLGRALSIELRVTASGGLAGEFTDTWHGLMAQPVIVRGTLLLARQGRAEPVFPESNVLFPPPPSVTPPALTAACIEIARQAARLPPGGCGASSSASEFFSCGNAARAVGARLEHAGAGLVVEVAGRGYGDFSDRCAADLDSASAEDPTTAPAGCVRPGNLTCAQSLFGRSSLHEGYQGAGMLVADYAAVGTLLINDELVNAFRLPYIAAVDDGAVEQQMVDALQRGRDRARSMLARIFDPHVLDSLRKTPGFLAEQDSYKALRRAAHLLARRRLASDERMRVLVRSTSLDPAERETLRQQIAVEVTSLLVGLMALGVIERAQAAPPLPELGLFTEGLTGLGKQFAQLADPQDPLGLPLGFVEFLYDPLMAGPGASTNYQQVLARHLIELEAARADETAAESAIREFDTNVSLLERELQEIENQTTGRLIAICGALAQDATQPALNECGTATGELALARSEIDIELQNVAIATTRIESHFARIEVLIGRIEAVEAIRNNTLEFIDETGDKLDAITYKDAAYQRTQEMISAGAGFLNSLTQIPSNPLAPLGGIINWDAMVINGAISDLRTRLAVERDRLLRTQQLEIMQADYAVESITLMAQLKDMYIQTSELNEELALVKLRAFTAGLRAQTLVEQVRILHAEQQLRAEQALGALANDPMFRVLRDRATAAATASRDLALLGIYKTARAFEFEINHEFPAILTDLVPAHRATQIDGFVGCMQNQFTAFRGTYGVPQAFVDEISLREDVLRIHGPIDDEVTGASISGAEQFRRLLLQPTNRSIQGGVGFRFATSLSPGNGVLSTGVCNDQIRSIQVKLIGDGLGDDQARIRLEQAGGSLMRSCASYRSGADDIIHTYQVLPRSVEIQAGVNSYPSSPPDSQLFGRASAASEWLLTIPPGDEAPTNADLDLSRIDDIVLRIEHSATSLSDASLGFSPTCN